VTTYTTSDISESTQAVTLTDDVYSRVAIADSDLDLSVVDFGKQILLPQTMAVAAKAESMVIAKLQTVAEDTALDTAYTMGTASTVVTLFALARRKLRALGAPQAGLYAAVGLGVAEDLMVATAKSKAEPCLGMAAGSRLMVILRLGQVSPELSSSLMIFCVQDHRERRGCGRVACGVGTRSWRLGVAAGRGCSRGEGPAPGGGGAGPAAG
jgi:hypothetical protein